MKARVYAHHLAQKLSPVGKGRIRQDCLLEALQDQLIIHASDGIHYLQMSVPATVEKAGKLVVFAPMLAQLLKIIGPQEVVIFQHSDKARVVVQLGDQAEYFLPLGFRQDDEDYDPLQAQATALMNEASPVVAFQRPDVWKDSSSAVKPYRGDWEFNDIFLVPLSQQPEWSMTPMPAAIVATDRTILMASLVTEQQATVMNTGIALPVPPELTAFPVQSFALASKEDKSYLYAILEDGFVFAPTDVSKGSHFHRIFNKLLFAPAQARLRFDATTWRHFKRAIPIYADKRVSHHSRSAIARWDIHPDGSHYIWSTVEEAILFTSEKAEVVGEIPWTCTFWTVLLEKAVKFVSTPSIIELVFQENSCMMRLHDQFNCRICVLMSMVSGNDYDSFMDSSERNRRNTPITPDAEAGEMEVSAYAEI
jgi:hypothetical protein